MIVGDSQWLGAASEAGHYVDLTNFVTEQQAILDKMAPATVQVLFRISRQQRQVLVDPDRRRRCRLVLSQGLVRRSQRKWRPSRRSTATIWHRRRTWKALTDIAEFFHRPDQKRYGVAIYTREPV
jgi:multiple sugar transport system substrate-binding protein